LGFGDWQPVWIAGDGDRGIISAKDRGGVGRQFQKFLQTDARSTRKFGRTAGRYGRRSDWCDTAIITGSRGYEGVGFALPSTVAINVYNQLVSSGRVTRGSIGVSFQEDLGTNAITLKSLGAANAS